MPTAKPLLLDAHAHLGDATFDRDRVEVLKRALEAGVGAVVTVGETYDEALRNLELAEQYPGRVLPCGGLYPTFLDLDHCDRVVALLRQERQRFVAIGEVGLDRWQVKEPQELEVQAEIFSRFIDLSIELDMPLNVHSRSAGRHAIALLLERGATRVLLHAYDGRAASALPAVEAGFYFSVPPSIVRSRQKQKLVQRLPLECLLVETDSPVLGPDPSERNEPANARLSLLSIAELKGIAEEEVRAQIVANASRLFGVEP